MKTCSKYFQDICIQRANFLQQKGEDTKIEVVTLSKSPAFNFWEGAEGEFENDYSDFLPEDIACAKTNITCINSFIQEHIIIEQNSWLYITSPLCYNCS